MYGLTRICSRKCAEVVVWMPPPDAIRVDAILDGYDS